MTTARAERDLLVIGVGNSWRGDDAAGPAAARRVRTLGGEIGLTGRFRVEEEVRDGAALMERWSGARRVWLIDAALGPGHAGRVHRLDAGRAPLPAGLALGSSHRFGVAEAVEVARRLDRLPESLVIYAIEAAGFAPGDDMSEPVAQAVMAVAESIVLEISSEEL